MVTIGAFSGAAGGWTAGQVVAEVGVAETEGRERSLGSGQRRSKNQAGERTEEFAMSMVWTCKSIPS